MEKVRVKRYDNKLVSIASIGDLSDLSTKPDVPEPEPYRIPLAIPSEINLMFRKILEPKSAYLDDDILEMITTSNPIRNYTVEIPKIYMLSVGSMTEATAALLENSRGGLDIYGTYSGLHNKDRKDDKVFFYISFDKEKAVFACSCESMLREGLPCGHIVSVLTSTAIAPEVIKRIYRLSNSKPSEEC
jgi:hypothetical protein